MKKKEFIKRYGVGAHTEMLARRKKWRDTHPEEISKGSRNQSRKGGKHYDEYQRKQKIGLRWARNKIRSIHRTRWLEYKKIIAPGSQIHHSWRPGTSKYDGVALVETTQHQQGIIDVIQIMEGEITIFTEAELRER